MTNDDHIIEFIDVSTEPLGESDGSTLSSDEELMLPHTHGVGQQQASRWHVDARQTGVPLSTRMDTDRVSRQELAMSSRLEWGAVIDDRYVIEGVIASGAMGRVYRGRHCHLERPVAIKILDVDQQSLDDKIYRERFKHEVKVMSKLEHSHIVRVFDFGYYGPRNIPYLVMQYLEGHDLRDELESGPLSPMRALRLTFEALSALGAIHRQGIVHKDIKPANLFVQSPGMPTERLVVIDLGVARIDASKPDIALTQMGEIAGTLEYLPPEYILDQHATPALDVYAMALVLIELLTGEPVIQGSSPTEILSIHLSGPIQVPAPLDQSHLAPILRRALASKPAQRFANASDFLDALNTVKPAFLKEVRQGLLGPVSVE